MACILIAMCVVDGGVIDDFVRVAVTPGCHTNGHTDRTGCHQLLFEPMHGRHFLPGPYSRCWIGYVDDTGCKFGCIPAVSNYLVF
jgi:hypothetical protein